MKEPWRAGDTVGLPTGAESSAASSTINKGITAKTSPALRCTEGEQLIECRLENRME